LGPNSRLAGGILPPNPKNPKLSRAFRESCWSYLVKIKNLHTSHIGSPLLNFLGGDLTRRFRKIGGGVKNWRVGHFGGSPPLGARTPHPTLVPYSTGNAKICGFYSRGESAPIWGRYGGFKFGFWHTLAYTDNSITVRDRPHNVLGDRIGSRCR